MTARIDKVVVKSQSKPDFASRKYGHWCKTASGEKKKSSSPEVCHQYGGSMFKRARETKKDMVRLC